MRNYKCRLGVICLFQVTHIDPMVTPTITAGQNFEFCCYPLTIATPRLIHCNLTVAHVPKLALTIDHPNVLNHSNH